MCTRPTEVFNDRKRGGKHSKREKGKERGKHSRGINISLRGSNHANLIQPNLRPHQLGIAQIIAYDTRTERYDDRGILVRGCDHKMSNCAHNNQISSHKFPYEKMQIYNLSLKMFSISLNSSFSKTDKSGINSFSNFRQKNLFSLKELWVIDLNLCLWMEHELRSYHFILLDQGYILGIFSVSHGAL